MSFRLVGTHRLPIEWGYSSAQAYTDPFNEIDLTVVFEHESGQTWRVPAYWAGDQDWRVRFAPPLVGGYTFSIVCTDTENRSLHEQSGELFINPYTGANPLFRHGAPQVAANGRTFELEDGTPFFWMGDTWWFNLSKRVHFPDEFQFLTADRVAKGYNVVQLVAGLYPDMASFDPRGAGDAGFPWEADYAQINPAWFDSADLRIQWLVRSGIVPCIVACWGYYLPMLGAVTMKKHWRYLIARWSAYPVVWCLAGELAMPYYLDPKFGTGDDPELAQAWVEIGDYVKAADPYGRLLSVHPSVNNPGRKQVTDARFMDFEMLQPGHDGYDSIRLMLDVLNKQRSAEPTMPVLVDEINYEDQGHNSHAEVQRLAFWTAVLSGSPGFTYGASGLWAFNTRDNPWGASPHGSTWSDMPWEEAYKLPGATQIGQAARLLSRYKWWRFEPHQDWVSPAGTPQNYEGLFAGGVPEDVRIIYSLLPAYPWSKTRKYVLALEDGIAYRAFWWDPRRAVEYSIGPVVSDSSGRWQIPFEPTLQDWVLVLERDTNA